MAIKDNTAVAGVRCTNGSTMVEWTPEYDATIVTRVMDAGGLILGKSGKQTVTVYGEVFQMLSPRPTDVKRSL